MFVSGIQKDLYSTLGVAKENGISNMQHKAICHFRQENLCTCLGGMREEAKRQKQKRPKERVPSLGAHHDRPSQSANLPHR